MIAGGENYKDNNPLIVYAINETNMNAEIVFEKNCRQLTFARAVMVTPGKVMWLRAGGGFVYQYDDVTKSTKTLHEIR